MPRLTDAPCTSAAAVRQNDVATDSCDGVSNWRSDAPHESLIATALASPLTVIEPSQHRITELPA